MGQSKEEYEASVCLCGSQVCRGSYLNLTGEGAFLKVLVLLTNLKLYFWSQRYMRIMILSLLMEFKGLCCMRLFTNKLISSFVVKFRNSFLLALVNFLNNICNRC